MSGRARVRWGLCGLFLVASACVIRFVALPFLAPEWVAAAAVAAAREEGLPLLDFQQEILAEPQEPQIDHPEFFEERATREDILKRLTLYASMVEAASQDPAAEDPAGEKIDPALEAQFQRREQARTSETVKGSLKSDEMKSADGIAVSASARVVAIATGERCQVYDIEASEESDAELLILPRSEPTEISLPGREGDSMLLDYDARHVVYLARGGVVWTADTQSGKAAPIDAERLTECVCLGGGLRGGWMVAGTAEGEVVLFDLQGTILKSEETDWPNMDSAPELQSVACDPEGEIVLAGFQNQAIRWFRRQQDQLQVDGGLAGFPGHVHSVTTNATQFAAAGVNFYFVCRTPEAGEPIDLKRSMICDTTHYEAQIALSGDDSAPCITLWGECPQIASDRDTVWLYSSHVRSGHMDRPFCASIEKTATLRQLATNGSLLAAVSDDSLLVARPAGRDTPPPASFGEMIRKLIDEERYDEIERCTWYLGDPQRRFPDYQEDWISCVVQVLLPSDGDYRVREDRLLEWLDSDPDSFTAWIAMAQHYVGSAWEARGGEFAKEVTDFGWEMVSQRVPKSDLIARRLLAASCEEPALFHLAASQSGIAGWSDREKQQLGERAVELFPQDIDLHTTLAFHRLQRWGGSAADAISHIEMVAEAADEKEQDAYYALLALNLLKHHPPHTDVEQVPIDLDRMHRGMQLPTPIGYNARYALSLVLQIAAMKGEIAYAGFYFDQLTAEHPLLPKAGNRLAFRSLNEWATGAHAMLVEHMKKVEEEAEEKAEADGDGKAEAGGDPAGNGEPTVRI